MTYPDGTTATVGRHRREHGQYQTRQTWWMAIRLQQQPLTLQAISLPGTGTVSADITPPVVALDDVLTNDSTPALTGTVNDPTATVVVNGWC